MADSPKKHGSLALQVSGLTKKYGNVTAVNAISFQVKKEEIFGFLGPNGAGKTTTVRILTGVIKADGGKAVVLGGSAGSLKAKQKAGVVPEMTNAYLDISGWDNLMLMAEIYGVPKRQAYKKAEELFKKIELYPQKGQKVRTYSKGMKQRLILAMSLISDPEILFLDEPTSGLDVKSARLIRGFIKELSSQGKTVFLTTHQMEEANQLCDRIAIIDQGNIVAIDPPEKLRAEIKEMHSVEVSFDRKVKTESLYQLPQVSTVERVGDKFRLYTSSPGEAIVSLVNYTSRENVGIISLNTLTPSLEDAFLALTER
ncbi:ATP-binding cassette domain-containing protein [bacterium]|nr:ATP-binding cassette domain-containing protein [bacterium]